jgi:hypothetical protein
MGRFRPFQVRLPSGDRYWTGVDAAYRPVAEADEWLLHVRLGRDRAESTTEAYARSLALFLDWCAISELDWRQAPYQFGRFATGCSATIPGPARAQLRVVRGLRRVNAVLAAVREFFKRCRGNSSTRECWPRQFDLVDDRDLPAEVRGDRQLGGCEPSPAQAVGPARVVTPLPTEVPALLKACRNARDRFIVLALWRVGNAAAADRAPA